MTYCKWFFEVDWFICKHCKWAGENLFNSCGHTSFEEIVEHLFTQHPDKAFVPPQWWKERNPEKTRRDYLDEIIDGILAQDHILEDHSKQTKQEWICKNHEGCHRCKNHQCENCGTSNNASSYERMYSDKADFADEPFWKGYICLPCANGTTPEIFKNKHTELQWGRLPLPAVVEPEDYEIVGFCGT